MFLMKRLIFWLFAALFFFVPIVLWPYTSEVFEFNKMVLVYILTAAIVTTWIIRSIEENKIIFRRTILDTPWLIFLSSQFVSTIISTDPRVSWLGYYSRFNGGLFSLICYATLYWAFVSNLEKDDAEKLITHSLLPSAVIVSLYGVAEHFGIDKNLWVQDVQNRVFSTLGQPNWLAAWLAALIPITWKGYFDKKRFWIYFCLSTLFFWTLIFTKSRSGYLAVATAFIVFWAFKVKRHLNKFLIVGFSLLAICLISGTEYTPSVYSFLNPKPKAVQQVTPSGTVLETGGTESGAIRKIVWTGAVDVWKHYPIFGTGVETFAFSYYQYRPVEHNLVSEWDFIYNKAHNEYLNFAANTGTVGLISYLVLVTAGALVLIKNKNHALLGGYLGLLVSNFFGFSVVPDQLELFLFPAFSVALNSAHPRDTDAKLKAGTSQKIVAGAVVAMTIYLFIIIARYWYADVEYNYGKNNNQAGRADVSTIYLRRAISILPNEPKYHDELASSYAALAVSANNQKDASAAAQFANLATDEEQTAVNLSPQNVLLKITEFGTYIRLSTINPSYLESSKQILLEAVNLAPTYAKLYYNLGLTYARTGEIDKALETLQKTVMLKPNYKEARLAYAYVLIDQKQKAEAKAQLEYILNNISPNDPQTLQALENLK